MTTLCEICRFPERNGWITEAPPRLAPGSFTTVHLGHWISLCHCPACTVRWAEVPTGPHDTISQLVHWPYSDNDFQMLHDIDNGKTLHAWHENRVVDIAIEQRTLKARFPRIDRTLKILRQIKANAVAMPGLNALLHKHGDI